MSKRILFLAALVSSIQLFAAEVGTLTGRFTDSSENPANKKSKIQASLYNLQYLSTDKYDATTQQQGQIEISHEGNDFINHKIDFLAGTFSTPKSSYFAMPEAYVGYTELDQRNFVALGRKIQILSVADRHQNLGIYNSYFSNDLLQFREQGLVGLHVGGHISNIGFYAGYYPYYLPNQGPQVYEQDGQIQAVNRWAKKPPAQFSFASQNHDIVYAIRDYKIADIMNHDGYAASLFFGEEAMKRPMVQVSYSRKPISEIPLSRDTFATATDFVGQVKLSPVVEYTQIQSIDLNFDAPLIQSSLSYIQDRPENKVAAQYEALQFLEPLNIYSGWVAFDLTNALEKTFILELSYAEIYGGEIRDLMADGTESIFTFSTRRTQFQKPFSVAVKSDLLFIPRKPILASIKWTYDRALKGSILSMGANIELIKKLTLNAGVDILGVEDDSDTAESNFIKDNQANDRIYAGLQYAF